MNSVYSKDAVHVDQRFKNCVGSKVLAYADSLCKHILN